MEPLAGTKRRGRPAATATAPAAKRGRGATATDAGFAATASAADFDLDAAIAAAAAAGAASGMVLPPALQAVAGSPASPDAAAASEAAPVVTRAGRVTKNKYLPTALARGHLPSGVPLANMTADRLKQFIAAVSKGEVEEARRIAVSTRGLDVHQHVAGDEAPLLVATKHRQAGMVAWLLSAFPGLNPYIVGMSGAPALVRASAW